MIDFITAPFNSFQNQDRISSQDQPSLLMRTQSTDTGLSFLSQNQDKVAIYVKTKTKRAIKLLLSSPIKLPDLCSKIQQKLRIKKDSQILFLNGKKISQQNSIKLEQKQIIHVLSKEDIVTQNEKVKIHLKVNFEKEPICETFNYQFSASSTGNDLIRSIQNQIQQKYGISEQYTINLLYSSRLLIPSLTFAQNKLCRQSQVLCLFSQNQMSTMFKHQEKSQNFLTVQQQKQKNVNKIKDKDQIIQKNVSQTEQIISQKSERNELADRTLQNIKAKSNAYLQNTFVNQSPAPKLRKKSQTLYISPSTPNFKKKHYFDEDGMTDESTLLKRIKVSKSKKQIQQIIELNLSNKKIQSQQNQLKDKDQVKSVVSSSSQQDANQEKKFTLYKPSPLIPKSMPSQQRNLIRQQIQKLFSSDTSSQTQKQQIKKTQQNIITKDSKEEKNQKIQNSKQLQFRNYGGLKLDFTPKSQRKVANKNLRSTLGSNFDLSKLRAKKNRYDDQDKKDE